MVRLGEGGPNLGISGFRLHRSPFFPDAVEATLRVVGTAPTEGWRVSLEDAETGQELQSLPQDRAFSFSDVPVARTYRARLLIEDGLELDNAAHAVLPRLGSVSGLLVSPLPQGVASLSQIPALRLERVSPQDYQPGHGRPFSVCPLSPDRTRQPAAEQRRLHTAARGQRRLSPGPGGYRP